MSRSRELIKLINTLPKTTRLTPDSLIQCNGLTKGDRKVVSLSLNKFYRDGFLARDGRGVYLRITEIPLPRDTISGRDRKKGVVKGKKREELLGEDIKVSRRRREGSRRPGETIPDEVGDFVLGRRETKGIHIKLTSTKLIDLIVNNDIEFRVKLRCGCVERNFQGEVVSLSLDAIDIIIDEG